MDQVNHKNSLILYAKSLRLSLNQAIEQCQSDLTGLSTLMENFDNASQASSPHIIQSLLAANFHQKNRFSRLIKQRQSRQTNSD